MPTVAHAVGLDARVRKLREDALAAKRKPTPNTFQGVSKATVARVLGQLDLDTEDRVDAVFALLDDVHDSWFRSAPRGMKFCAGASVAHIACHVGILQRGNVKLDREGRDYWVKPLRDVGAVEPVFLDPKRRAFVPGHPVPKSPNSAYRLAADFLAVLKAPATKGTSMLRDWASVDRLRERLAFQAAQAAESRRTVDTSHADLIAACVQQYAPRFLPGFEVVYVDDSDGERVDQEDRDRLRDAGLVIELGDAMPDVLLYNAELDELWVIEAVTSDGEVDEHKVRRMVAFADRHGKPGVGFTTAYTTWRAAARRQAAHKNIPPSTYIWIREDASKHYLAESFAGGANAPSTIPSTPG
jgi:hypothetical protein